MNIKKVLIHSIVLLTLCPVAILKSMSEEIPQEEKYSRFEMRERLNERIAQARKRIEEERIKQMRAILQTRKSSTGPTWYLKLSDIKNNSNSSETVQIKYPAASEALKIELSPQTTYKLDKTLPSKTEPVIIKVGDNPGWALWVDNQGWVNLSSESDKEKVVQYASAAWAIRLIINKGKLRIEGGKLL